MSVKHIITSNNFDAVTFDVTLRSTASHNIAQRPPRSSYTHRTVIMFI